MHPIFKQLAASLLAFAPALVAQASPPPPADLTVLATRGQLFTLLLDGRPLTGGATRQVHGGWLAPGRHWADVRVFSPYGPPVGFRTTVWLQPGLDSRYVLTTSPYGPRLEAVGAVVPGGPGSYGGYGQGGYNGGPGGYGAPGGYGNGPGGYGQAPGTYRPSPGGTYPNGGTYPDGSYPAPGPPQQGGYPPSPAPGGAYGAPGAGDYDQPNQAPTPQDGYDPNQAGTGYPDATNGTLAPLSAADVRDLARELREQPTDEGRLAIARQALANSSLQASDLASLLQVFSTERSRIALAELGYANLSDPANMGQVYALLRPASVAEVQRALNLQRAY